MKKELFNELVESILKNNSCKLEEADLEDMKLNQLQKICDSFVVENSNDSGSQSYEGQQGVNPQSLRMNAQEFSKLGDPLGLPSSSVKS